LASRRGVGPEDRGAEVRAIAIAARPAVPIAAGGAAMLLVFVFGRRFADPADRQRGERGDGRPAMDAPAEQP
jgi:hypothetical protein